ncbi:DUF4362 domain-containing protein [Chengkuizengella sediminis]|uniref:DUF4362 domain-containing protein n=1 Tax=Chengkuizengella sediminis TaxID=1885917 RepID=UPI00138A17AE|nr:DUF4362 domain-containing protein [Chengkuizengella sediminis]NDI35473.1 DUF4362 domain-containing protein [Chengkuizengella sediminis]
MKKLKFLIIILIIIVISGCSEYNPSHDDINADEDISEYNPLNDDIVDKHGEITNIDIFMRFIENFDQGNKDEIKIVRYTVEGDAILRDLEYDGENIITTIDTTRDRYGKRRVSTFICKTIKVEATEEMNLYKHYLLNGCNQENIDTSILVIQK